MSKLDRVLFFGVWGVLVGLALFYGFHFLRGITGQLMIALTQALMDPDSSVMDVSTVLLNLAHTVIAGTPVVVISSVFMLFVLRERRLVYGLIPSFVFFGLSYKDLLLTSEYGGDVIEVSYYIWRAVDPVLFVALFIFSYWLLGLLFAPDNRLQIDAATPRD